MRHGLRLRAVAVVEREIVIMKTLSHTNARIDNHHKIINAFPQRSQCHHSTYRAHNCCLPVKYCKELENC